MQQNSIVSQLRNYEQSYQHPRDLNLNNFSIFSFLPLKFPTTLGLIVFY